MRLPPVLRKLALTAEPEAHAIACLRPSQAANPFSKRVTNVPRVLFSVPLRITSVSSGPQRGSSMRACTRSRRGVARPAARS